MRILAVETSCDETAVALMELQGGVAHVVHQEVASQIEQHRPFGGVVPELATRQHLLHLDPMIRALLEKTNCALPDLDGFAVTQGPDLPRHCWSVCPTLKAWPWPRTNPGWASIIWKVI
ncbi:MAG: hypothetical protein HC904_07585 [Blastochloris sp.]|nr:hypothetical protein [Blastochloris sp.]